MIDTQLGRRNLTPIQRIAIAEKYRPIIEKKAKENQSVFKGNQYTNGTCQNSDKKQIKKVDTKKELSKIANVSFHSTKRLKISFDTSSLFFAID